MAATAALVRTVIYGRSSLENRRSVDDQIADMLAVCQASGRHVVAVLRDDGIGASRHSKGKERKDWAKALELITTGKTDELGVWETSRATRDLLEWAALQQACVAAGVVLNERGRVLDPRNPDDALVLGLRAVVNQHEVDQLRERVQRNLTYRVANGLPHGQVPFGYRRICDPDTGKVLRRDIHPERGPVVREAVRRLVAGESAHAIAADFTDRGIKTSKGGRWSGGNMVKMLRSPSYRGLRQHQGEIVAGVSAKWPPLISDTEWSLLRAVLEDPARDRWRHSTTVTHLGSGIFRCGRCDGGMRVNSPAGNRPLKYSCRECHKVSRDLAKVDALVEAVVVARLSRPDIAAELAALSNDEGAKAAAGEVDQLTCALRDYQDFAQDRRKAGQPIGAAEFWREVEALKAQLADAEARARPRGVPAEVWRVAGQNAVERWEAAPVRVRRTIVRSLFTVVIQPAGRGKWKWDPDLIEVRWRSA